MLNTDVYKYAKNLSDYHLWWYEDEFFWYVWKNHGLATVFGKKYSLLDVLIDMSKKGSVTIDELEGKNAKLLSLVMGGLEIFGVEGELGLVNRLDNDTAGLVYFAKSQKIFDDYTLAQREAKVYKWYVVDVVIQGNMKHETGKMFTDECGGKKSQGWHMVGWPVYHHKHLQDRMVVWKSPKDDGRVRGRRHLVETWWRVLDDSDCGNILTVLVCIQSGSRHQVRAHLASVGMPVVGDRLYGGENVFGKCDQDESFLHLWSVGMEVGC